MTQYEVGDTVRVVDSTFGETEEQVGTILYIDRFRFNAAIIYEVDVSSRDGLEPEPSAPGRVATYPFYEHEVLGYA